MDEDDRMDDVGEAAGSVGPPAYKLYSEGALVFATLLGSAIAGGIVLTIDLKRLGRPREAWLWLAGTAIVSVIVLWLAIRLPENFPGIVLWLPPLLVMTGVGRSMLRRPLARHRAAGGEVASTWGAVGIGLLGCVVLLIVGVGMLLLVPPFPGDRVEVRGNEIYFSGGATESEATPVVELLVEEGFLGQGDMLTLHLAKTECGYSLDLLVEEDAWEDAGAWGRHVVGKVLDAGYGPRLDLRYVAETTGVWRTFRAP